MSLLLHSPRKDSGFTLIEILITVIVLSIGLLGLAGLQINGLRANMSSEARSKASALANDIAERMRANPLGVQNDNADDDNQYANISMTADDCGDQPDPFCSNYNDGSSQTADECTPAQMAAFDAWLWACGMPKADGVVPGGLTNILTGGTGSVVCNDADVTDTDTCSPGSSHTITISWNELSPNQSEDTEAGETINQAFTLVVVP